MFGVEELHGSNLHFKGFTLPFEWRINSRGEGGQVEDERLFRKLLFDDDFRLVW